MQRYRTSCIQVTEPVVDGYATTYDNCTDVFIQNGGSATCTITNGDIAAAPIISAQTTASPTRASLTVTWTTDHNATSRVIYDTVSHADLGTAPNYGYANSTGTSDEDPMVTSHSITISGLSSGTTYFFRTVSHGSPETVSAEFSGTTSNPPSGGGGGGGGGGSYFVPVSTPTPPVTPPVQGQVLGVSTTTVQTSSTAGLCSNNILITKYLRRGRANDPAQVKKLQQFLNGEMNSTLPTTGFFGSLTEKVVKAFQTKYASDVLTPWGLTTPTGYVYKSTQFKINAIHCTVLGVTIDIPFPAL